MAMTKAQAKHLENIINAFSDLVRGKYERGVNQHGGNLWDRSELALVEEAVYEAIDQFTYLITLRRKILDRVATVKIHDSNIER